MPIDPAKSARIFIGRLSRNVTKEHVTEIFGTYGTIKNIEMPFDTIHQSFYKGFAYVEYENAEDANKAWKYMDGGQIDGQEVKVAMSVPAPVRNKEVERSRGVRGGGRNRRDRESDRKRDMAREKERDRNRDRDRDRRRNSPVRRQRSPPRRDRTPDRRGGQRGGSPRRRSRSPVSRRSRSPRKYESTRRRRHSTSSSGSSSDSD